MMATAAAVTAATAAVTAAAGPWAGTEAGTRAHMRPAWPIVRTAMVTMMVPAAPSGAAAPAIAAAMGVTAPVEARAVPAVWIEAIVAAAERELCRQHSRLSVHGGIDRHRTRRRHRAGEGKGECRGCSKNPLTHWHLPCSAGDKHRRGIAVVPTWNIHGRKQNAQPAGARKSGGGNPVDGPWARCRALASACGDTVRAIGTCHRDARGGAGLAEALRKIERHLFAANRTAATMRHKWRVCCGANHGALLKEYDATPRYLLAGPSMGGDRPWHPGRRQETGRPVRYRNVADLGG